MPRIKSYAPSWLKEPAPGHKLFAESDEDAKLLPSQFRTSSKAKPGPRRAIARRGTEIFVAAGKQIRWGNLAHLKESWESKQPRSHGFGSRSGLGDLTESFEIYDENTKSRGEHGGPSEGYRVSVHVSILQLDYFMIPNRILGTGHQNSRC